jgi:hypothetical protein
MALFSPTYSLKQTRSNTTTEQRISELVRLRDGDTEIATIRYLKRTPGEVETVRIPYKKNRGV